MALIETEIIESATVHVMECSVCSYTCEQVNSDYDYCPHCGDFAGKTVFEQYFSTPSSIARNWILLETLFNSDLSFKERLDILDEPYTYLFKEDYKFRKDN